MARELADAQGSIAELAAEKQSLEGSLAATKASLQTCEDKLVSAEVRHLCCLLHTIQPRSVSKSQSVRTCRVTV